MLRSLACNAKPCPPGPPPLPLQQAKSEIAGLAEVTATNAQLMQEELLHHQVTNGAQCAWGGHVLMFACA